MNHLSLNIVCRRWIFRAGLLEQSQRATGTPKSALRSQNGNERRLDFKGMWQAFKNQLLFSTAVCLECFSLISLAFYHIFFPSMLQHPHNAHKLKWGLGCHSLPQRPLCTDTTCFHKKESSTFQTVFLSTVYYSSSGSFSSTSSTGNTSSHFNSNKKRNQHLFQMWPDGFKDNLVPTFYSQSSTATVSAAPLNFSFDVTVPHEINDNTSLLWHYS